MSSNLDVRKGMVIRQGTHLYRITDVTTSQSGKQKGTVHVSMRSLHDGHLSERSLAELGRIEEVPTSIRSMQYLYAAGGEHVFMDTETFEQYSLGVDVLGDGMQFLVMEETFRFLTVEGQPVTLQLLPAVVLEVVDTAPVEHAGGGANVMKEAKLNCGLTVRVPLFIKNGDRIRVGTDHRDYQGKEH